MCPPSSKYHGFVCEKMLQQLSKTLVGLLVPHQNANLYNTRKNSSSNNNNGNTKNNNKNNFFKKIKIRSYHFKKIRINKNTDKKSKKVTQIRRRRRRKRNTENNNNDSNINVKKIISRIKFKYQ